MASLDALPAEIILHIHLLSTSSTLPYVSKYVHSCIRSSSTPSYRARWLLLRLAREGYGPSSSSSSTSTTAATTHEKDPFDNIRRGWLAAGPRVPRGRLAATSKTKDADSTFLNRALKYPICDLDTVRVLESICLKALNERLQLKFKKEKMLKITAKLKKQNKHTSAYGSTSTSAWSTRRHDGKEKLEEEEKEPPVVRFLPLTPRSIDIPKRLFRNLLSTPPPSSFAVSTSSSSPTKSSTTQHPTRHDTFDNEDFPFILHLITQLQANPNSNKGYSLAKAVLARHMPLIRILLDAGADPSIKDHMAVMLAVGRGDLEIVRLLIERQEDGYYDSSVGTETTQRDSTVTSRKRKRRAEGGDSGSPKKRKLEDRIQVTSDMLGLAVKQGFEPLIQFFMSKGAVPSLKTLQMLHQT